MKRSIFLSLPFLWIKLLTEKNTAYKKETLEQQTEATAKLKRLQSGVLKKAEPKVDIEDEPVV